MDFDTPLTQARLIRRYKRFLADVELPDGSTATAHCANSGSMLGCAAPGSTVWLSPNRSKTAKLPWRWEMVEVGGHLVGINTNRPNRLVEEAILAGQIPELAGYATLRREVAYGQASRIDLLLEQPGLANLPLLAYVEVKNVTLRDGDLARFPDAVTARGRKHLEELAAMAAAGHRAVMVFLVQRGDCQAFAPADAIDPGYGETLRRVAGEGVEMLAYRCRLSPQAIGVDRPLPIRLDVA
ncbi:sugar fermentation stimulation protein SfsA [Rhodothalassium salexigens]|uniref:DNA/RNA nuclease SfsA n=1 Tax=Rhodothalassium salexigens TaxID=1086 RepID=UPI001914C709|nr:DNA/RNA nuclease SfsA [Rhodothalassium salexigens]MBK5910420.1 sugar fermentation stimulation protein SfsA [Rhodothalassium salexigens]MBK5919819.1 sugar fermentation stimulation protein SfsA [Rhodothalassium salexigens]